MAPTECMFCMMVHEFARRALIVTSQAIIPFFKYSSLFIPRALSFFPCLAAQKTFFSYRNFWNKEFHFLKGKKLAILKKNGILGSMHDIFHHLEEQKNLFCFSQACFGLRAVFGIFLAFRRPSAFFRPKNPSNSPQAKTTWLQQKKFFFLPHDSYVVAFLLKIYQTPSIE